jgi:His/Glu/Gln/Arg/opine family amino acid ABC transporter permease subunit
MIDWFEKLWSTWGPVLGSTGAISEGIYITLAVSFASFGLACIGGLVLTLMRLSGLKWLEKTAFTLTQIFRSLSAYVYVLFIYFALPALIGIPIPPIVAGIIGLTILNSAYIAEILRSALSSVGSGQREAAAVLGMSTGRTYTDVILPQGIRVAIPSLVSQLTIILKDSSIIGVIGVADIMYRASHTAALTFQYFEYYTLVGLMYVVVVFILSTFSSWVERKLRIP